MFMYYLLMMSKVISIRELNTLPIPASNVFGIEVRKYYADGVMTIVRTLPGKKHSEQPKWFQLKDDGKFHDTHTRILSSEVCDEEVSKFWNLEDKSEIHEYLSPEIRKGSVEIRMNE